MFRNPRSLREGSLLTNPQGQYSLPLSLPVVAASDGAGKVLAVGSKVTQFSKGDSVVTLFTQGHQHGPITNSALGTTLGGLLDGTLRHYAVFPESGIVKAPANLSPIEVGTLSCAPLTAWNALFGLESKAVKPGSVVLTLGTGGVSLSALQFAKAAGATVIATTSSAEKADRLKKLGADHVINYKTDPNWGETAKKLSPGGEGVDHVIEVGGPGSIAQSLKGEFSRYAPLHANLSLSPNGAPPAIKYEGVINVIGFLAGPKADNEPSILTALNAGCIIRGILIGSKAQLIDMNRAIEASDIHPIVDEKIFGFDDAIEAYKYQWQQKNFGKVVVQVS